jgi:hypothetical protein
MIAPNGSVGKGFAAVAVPQAGAEAEPAITRSLSDS